MLRVVVLFSATAIMLGVLTQTLEAGVLRSTPIDSRAATRSAALKSSPRPEATHVAATPLSPFGVEANGWPFGNVAGSGTLATEVAATGAAWTRINLIQWSVVQPTENSGYAWTFYDAVLAAPAAHGLTPMMIIGDTPSWAAKDPTLPSGPIATAHLGQFVLFVQAAVARYSLPPYNVRYWDLFNEPDNTQAAYAPWISTWGNDGGGYAEMLRQTYPAVKAVDPASTVVMGGIAYDWFTDQGGPFSRNFINDVLAAGGGNYFDVLAFHYYATFGPVWAPYGVDILGKTNYLRGILAAYGFASKAMACTEMGQFGPPNDPTALKIQAEYVPQVYARGMSAHLVNLIWYSLVDEPGNTTGLMNLDGSPKPAHKAYQVAATELGPVKYVQTIAAPRLGLSGPAAQAFEGYLFRVASTSGYRGVIWLTSGSATVSVLTPAVDVTTTDGTASHVLAGPDGWVRIPLDQNPLYLDLLSNPWPPLAPVALPLVFR